MTTPMGDEVDRLQEELAVERTIVNRIWDLFGSPDYKSLGGKSIYDLILDERKAREGLQSIVNLPVNQCYKQLQAAEQRVAALEAILRDFVAMLQYHYNTGSREAMNALQTVCDQAHDALEGKP